MSNEDPPTSQPSEPRQIVIAIDGRSVQITYHLSLADVPTPSDPESRYYRDAAGGVFAFKPL